MTGRYKSRSSSVASGPGFRLSGKLIQLGALASASTDLATVSERHMQALVEELSETCHVGVLEGHAAVTVALVDGSYAVRMHSWVGKRDEAHTTAMGEVLLAALPESELHALYPDGPLIRRTDTMISTAAELRKHLTVVRDSAFALDDEEYEHSLRAVAAPIHDRTGEVIAAVAISGAASRPAKPQLDSSVEKVRGCAAKISAELGAP
ncbi:IclR family transcriptional regulator [Streptomyces sp. NBC_00310]|uniref:IclR family transcriptional regulator n=1 Tax=Streptomyces sp. NBC_00310 TaxID=2903645 RepID=UPI003FA72C2A